MQVNQQPNTLVTAGDIEENVLLVGGEDPGLVESIVSDTGISIQPVASNRGFLTYKCISSQTFPFTLAISGVGPAATEIAVTEYANCGARVIIRAGTSGALSRIIENGTVVISTRALRFDGVSDLYLNRRFHAIADRKIIRALERSAENLKVEYTSGLTLSTSGFYAMGGTSAGDDIVFSGKTPAGGFEPAGLEKLRDMIAENKPLNIEMETATLLILARVYGILAGSVCGISNRVPWEEGEQVEFTGKSLQNAILVGIGALDYLYHKNSGNKNR